MTILFDSFWSGEVSGLGQAMLEEQTFELVIEDPSGAPRNARFARSVSEQAYAHMATRALHDSEIETHEMHEMVAEDLPFADRPVTQDDQRIGFRPR